jgi:hypothetical protein
MTAVLRALIRNLEHTTEPALREQLIGAIKRLQKRAETNHDQR